MDLPGGYQGNFSLIAASLPLFCCSAGNSLVPSVSPHPLSGTSTPSASSGEPETRHDLRQNCEDVFSYIWPSTVGPPQAEGLVERQVPDTWLWRKRCVPAIHIWPASVLASVEETSTTYNLITSRQGSWLKHIIKTSLNHCYSENIAFWVLRYTTRKHKMTEKVRVVTPILPVILCFSDPEKKSNFKYPAQFFFYAFPPFHWMESTFIYVLVCTGMN